LTEADELICVKVFFLVVAVLVANDETAKVSAILCEIDELCYALRSASPATDLLDFKLIRRIIEVFIKNPTASLCGSNSILSRSAASFW
jgi:hypothetical protein